MKKLIVGLLAAFMMTTGLVAVTSSAPAQAGCTPGYARQCFTTATSLAVTPSRNGPARRTFIATVKAKRTNMRPVGTATFRFKRVGGGVQLAVRNVRGNRPVTLTRSFRAGVWKVSVTYKSPNNSAFLNSKSAQRQFRVR